MSTALFDPIKTMSKLTDSVIVGLSTGKESVVTLDLCCRYFKNVSAYHMHICPNLGFQERTLQWYERKYGIEVLRLPRNKKEVLEYIKHHRLKIGEESKYLGSSFYGLHGKCLIEIKKHFPEDYEKLLHLYPRLMDEEAKKRLKKNIAKHGLVSALTWNKRTGNLVGGHQRLEQLDALEKSKDYELTVCVVDVDEREEAALNVQLNNPSMQGEWDFDKLAMVADEFDLDLKDDLGFTELDIDLMFEGDDRFSQLFENKEVEDLRGAVENVKNTKASSIERMKEKDSIDWYVVIVFDNQDKKNDFLKEISIPKYERYITEDQVRRIQKKD